MALAETSGDGIFSPDIQSHFMEGIFLQDVFSFEICTIIFFRLLIKFGLLILSETENGIKSFIVKWDVLYMWCPFHKSYRNKLVRLSKNQ